MIRAGISETHTTATLLLWIGGSESNRQSHFFRKIDFLEVDSRRCDWGAGTPGLAARRAAQGRTVGERHRTRQTAEPRNRRPHSLSNSQARRYRVETAALHAACQRSFIAVRVVSL